MPTGSNLEFEQDGTLQINVDISGVPPPNVTWRFNGANIVSDPRITTARTGLTITNVRHTDAGMYSVTAENCADTETEDYDVVINCEFSLLVVNALTRLCHFCSSTTCNIDKNS